MWKKRIALWLISLLFSIAVLSGCSAEMQEMGGELVGEIVDGVINDVLSDLESEGEAKVSDLDDENWDTQWERDSQEVITTEEETNTSEQETAIAEDGSYTSKEAVALYLHTYGYLPSNYITKKEAQNLGWVSKEGNLWDVAYGKSIGGDKFGNNEGLLPKASGRQYYECDIDFDGGFRDAKRIVYSNDGLIYYTEDHYQTFEQLYP